MKVYGVEINKLQLDAGIAAMTGEFRMLDVMGALIRAGVPERGGVAGRACDRLLQQERKAGRIIAVANRVWCSTATL